MYNAQVNKKTVAYVRVSTEEQASCGHSLDNQKARIEAYATALDLDSPTFMIDAGYSAKSLERPNLKKLIEGVTRGEIGTVIIYKLDRLTRSVVDLGSLMTLFNAKGVSLVSVSENLDTSSASGRMFINILGVLSQWERETISERTTTTLGHLREQGRQYGPTPYGYYLEDNDGTMYLAKLPEQQRIITDMEKMRTMGMSYLAISKYLNDQEVPTPRGGKKWYASSVRSVLTSEMATA